jgi:thiol-disulfide isomerase/thioredoxin
MKKAYIILFAVTLVATSCKNTHRSSDNQKGSTSTQEFPQFTMTNASGETVEFSALKGKTVFVNLWATWCPPCVAEMPSIEKLYQRTKSDNNAFVLLSLDEDFEKAKKWVKARNLDIPIYTASQLPSMFEVRSIPTTFIFQPDGKLLFTHVGMEDYSKPRFEKIMRAQATNTAGVR